jgi:hypothetical protein
MDLDTTHVGNDDLQQFSRDKNAVDVDVTPVRIDRPQQSRPSIDIDRTPGEHHVIKRHNPFADGDGILGDQHTIEHGEVAGVKRVGSGGLGHGGRVGWEREIGDASSVLDMQAPGLRVAESERVCNVSVAPPESMPVLDGVDQGSTRPELANMQPRAQAGGLRVQFPADAHLEVSTAASDPEAGGQPGCQVRTGDEPDCPGQTEVEPDCPVQTRVLPGRQPGFEGEPVQHAKRAKRTRAELEAARLSLFNWDKRLDDEPLGAFSLSQSLWVTYSF